MGVAMRRRLRPHERSSYGRGGYIGSHMAVVLAAAKTERLPIEVVTHSYKM